MIYRAAALLALLAYATADVPNHVTAKFPEVTNWALVDGKYVGSSNGKRYRVFSSCPDAACQSPAATGSTDFSGRGNPQSLTKQGTTYTDVMGVRYSTDEDKMGGRLLRAFRGLASSGSPAPLNGAGQQYDGLTGEFLGDIGIGCHKGHYFKIEPKVAGFELGGYFIGADSREGFWGTKGPAEVAVYGSNDDSTYEFIDITSFERFNSDVIPGRTIGTSKGYKPDISNTEYAEQLQTDYGLDSFVSSDSSNVGVAHREFAKRYSYRYYAFVFTKIVPTGNATPSQGLISSLDLLNANP